MYTQYIQYILDLYWINPCFTSHCLNSNLSNSDSRQSPAYHAMCMRCASMQIQASENSPKVWKNDLNYSWWMKGYVRLYNSIWQVYTKSSLNCILLLLNPAYHLVCNFASVVYARIFKQRKIIPNTDPKYEKLMVVFCACTHHILIYPNIYRHMTSYDGIWLDIRVSGFQMLYLWYHYLEYLLIS